MRILAGTLIILLLSFSGSARADAARDTALLTRLFAGAQNNLKLWEVLDRVIWNWRSGELSRSDEDYLKGKGTETADLNDHGGFAKILAEQGYNYAVLRHLRRFLREETFDVASLAVTQEGLEPAGIPPFLSVQVPEGMQTDFGRILIIQYDRDIYNALSQLKSTVDQVLTWANNPRQPLVQAAVAWIFNRFRAAKRIVATTAQIERTLNLYQSLLASLESKRQLTRDQTLQIKFEQIYDELRREKDGFVKKVNDTLAAARIGASELSYWRRLDQALTASGFQESSLAKQFFVIASKYVSAIDQAEGTSDAENKFISDTPAELESQRLLHEKDLAKLAERWANGSTETYFKREDKWLYRHLHSEEHSPYYEQSREIRSEDVHFTRIAPILEEELVIRRLFEIGKAAVSEKWSMERILAARSEIAGLREAYVRYRANGSVQAHDSAAHFKQRNEIIEKAFALTTDANYRHEAHARNGYIGMTFSEDLDAKYEGILASLRGKSTRIMIMKLSAGAVTAGSAVCGYLMLGG